MRLVRLARARWDVLAMLAEDGEFCDVLDFLLEKRYGQQATRRSLFAFLRESVPFYGPREDNPELCQRMRPFEDGLYEFRKQPSRGQKVRVLFFKDGHRIICVNGFLKTDATPQRKLSEAVALRLLYFEDRRRGNIEIVDLDEE
jgi:hypothetical protein